MRPNILYINSHDTGQYIQPYGYAVPTPNLQTLAEAGVLFRNCFCAAPTCSPSRAALLTGQTAHSSGMLGLAHRGFALKDVKEHLAYWLKHEQGYHTALVGVQHVVDWNDPSALDYDTIMSERPETVQDAVSFLKTYKGQKPFYLELGFLDTHRYANLTDSLGPFNPEGQRGDTRYVRPPAPLPDTPETRRDMADFTVCAARLDANIGAVLKALEESGHAANTLVIYTTDHGVAFPNMKCSLTDHGTKVALILRGPDLEGGEVIDGLVSHLDIFPTLCDYLSAAPPPHLQGHSLLTITEKDVEQVRSSVYAEVNFHAALEPKRMVRTTRYKYIRRFGDYPQPVLPNTDDSPSKSLWLEHGWAERTLDSEQLFDLMFDPNEANNLIENVRYQAVLADMRVRLDSWMMETDDPLLRGKPEPPGGAELNPVNGLSPNEPTIIVGENEP